MLLRRSFVSSIISMEVRRSGKVKAGDRIPIRREGSVSEVHRTISIFAHELANRNIGEVHRSLCAGDKATLTVVNENGPSFVHANPSGYLLTPAVRLRRTVTGTSPATELYNSVMPKPKEILPFSDPFDGILTATA